MADDSATVNVSPLSNFDRTWWRVTCPTCGVLGDYGTRQRAHLEADDHRARHWPENYRQEEA